MVIFLWKKMLIKNTNIITRLSIVNLLCQVNLTTLYGGLLWIYRFCSYKKIKKSVLFFNFFILGPRSHFFWRVLGLGFWVSRLTELGLGSLIKAYVKWYCTSPYCLFCQKCVEEVCKNEWSFFNILYLLYNIIYTSFFFGWVTFSKHLNDVSKQLVYIMSSLCSWRKMFYPWLMQLHHLTGYSIHPLVTATWR